MPEQYLAPGIYTNIFKIDIEDQSLDAMVADRNLLSDLRPLRDRILRDNKDIMVWAEGKFVYGFGANGGELTQDGFLPQSVALLGTPKLTRRLIENGLEKLVIQKGYLTNIKGRPRIFKTSPEKIIGGRINVFQGFDLKVMYWYWDDLVNFGLVVDVVWSLTDSDGTPVNLQRVSEIVPNGVNQIAQVQGELLPGNRWLINTQISQQRLQGLILPFIHEFSSIPLIYSPSAAIVQPEPIRAVLGV